MTALVGDKAVIAHGYTMGHVDRLANRVARDVWVSRLIDESEKREAAWFAMIEMLYEEAERPTPGQLIWAGKVGVFRSHESALRHHGLAKRYDFAPSPRFSAYWMHHAGHTGDDFTEKIAERLALPQVLAVLTPKQYEAIVALAVHRKQTIAAEALGLEIKTFQRRIQVARKRLKEVWFGPETPRITVSTKEACKWGHLYAEYGVLKTDGRVHCGECAREAARRSARRRRGAGDSALEAEEGAPS